MTDHNANTIIVWDPLVRLFHWTLVVAFVLAYFSQEGPFEHLLDGKLLQLIHVWAGYTLVGLLLRGIVPWWFVVILLSRDVVMAVVLWVLKRRGVVGLPVHFLGKAATFNLLYAFPLLLLGDGNGWWAQPALVFGWAFAVWGTALYWWAGVLYIGQARRIMSETAEPT